MFSTDERTHSSSIVLALLTFIAGFACVLGSTGVSILIHVPLLYTLSFLDITKVFQYHTVDPVEKQDLEHLEKGPTMFIIPNFSFLIVFWSSTKIYPGNLLFSSSLLAFSFHVNFGEYLRRRLDFVIGSDVALGLSIFTAILRIPWHFGGQVLDICVTHMVLSVYLWLSQSDSELLLLLGPAVLVQGTR